jgi:hypothetical protein
MLQIPRLQTDCNKSWVDSTESRNHILDAFISEERLSSTDVETLELIINEMGINSGTDLPFAWRPRCQYQHLWYYQYIRSDIIRKNWNNNQRCNVHLITPTSYQDACKAMLDLFGHFDLVVSCGHKHSWSPIVCSGRVDLVLLGF